jgi:hypothetical protein
MTKQKTSVAVDVLLNDVNYKSLSDLGYSVAKKSDAAKLDGKFAVEHIAGFPDAISSEARDELYVGFRLRASEISDYKPVEYGVVDGNYIPVSQLKGDLPKERYIISVASAYSYSQQQFGAMKRENPQLYAIVQSLRERVSKYCSGCLGDLKRAARAHLKLQNPVSDTRAATLAFIEYLDKTFDTMITRCDNAASRGNDDTADKAKLKDAIVAFKSKYPAYNK